MVRIYICKTQLFDQSQTLIKQQLIQITHSYTIMFKFEESSVSAKKLRKSKLIDLYKKMSEKSVPETNPKIMLTDLCPEEKAKIGELVKALELRKHEKAKLESQVDEMYKLEEKYQQKIKQMQENIKQSNLKEREYHERISTLQLKEQEKQKQIQQMAAELHHHSMQKSNKTDQFTTMDRIVSNEYGCQAIPKKKKLKHKNIQTQQEQSTRMTVKRYASNSRSFQKIMKGTQPPKYKQSNQSVSVQPHENHNQSYEEGTWRNYHNSAHTRSKNRSRNQEMRIEDVDVRVQEADLSDGDQSEDFHELARKWLELKEKNMSKIKKSYIEPKPTTNYDYSPDQFEINAEDNEGGESGSFAPHNKHTIRDIKQVDEQSQFDEIQLNKILKANNFSASRLIAECNPKRNSKINSYVSSKNSTENSKLKQGNIKSVAISQSPNIDFYETDLLDIVNKINY